MKTFLVAVCLLGGANFAWGDDVVVPTPVYFNDFSSATSGSDGIEIVGNGVFEDDADARFGRIFHNDPTLTKAVRTNYLKLPADVLSHSGTSKEMTIGFWVNMKDAADFYFSPLFTAYPNATKASDADSPWPIFTCLARKVVSLNCWGYCDLGNTYNDKGKNAETSAWLDDKAWHYYTITLTSTAVKVYIDGVVENSWTVDGKSDAQVINGLFEAGAAYTVDTGLKYICLGGNQSNNYNDPDPAFGFDDFAIYDVALSADQIKQIRANKLVIGTRIGNSNCTSGYVSDGAMTDKVTLRPGESYSYKFINYNNGGTDNYMNYVVPVYNPAGDRVITVRADRWEDMHHVDEVWGSSAGCTCNFNWTNWNGNMNGATVDMTVSFTKEKVFNMSASITAVDGSEWTYSYTNDYTDSPINLTSSDYVKVALAVSSSWLDLLSEGFCTVAATIPASGYGTIASAYALDCAKLPNGLKAYKVSALTSTTVTLEEVTEAVAANTGLILKGTASTAYSIPVAESGTDISTTNKLKAAVTATAIDANKAYILQGGLFHLVNAASTIPAGKAYLLASDITGGGARSLNFTFDATAIKAVEGEIQNGEFYNVAGQRVAQPTKGLYIVNGKKIVVK